MRRSTFRKQVRAPHFLGRTPATSSPLVLDNSAALPIVRSQMRMSNVCCNGMNQETETQSVVHPMILGERVLVVENPKEAGNY